MARPTVAEIKRLQRRIERLEALRSHDWLSGFAAGQRATSNREQAANALAVRMSLMLRKQVARADDAELLNRRIYQERMPHYFDDPVIRRTDAARRFGESRMG